MKRFLSFFVCIALMSNMFAQSEHYDIHPKFPHNATAEEQQLLRTWYQNVKTSTPPTGPVTAVSEFQPMSGVLVAYPLGIPVNLVSELSFITSVKVIVNSGYDSVSAKSYFSANGVNMDNVQFWLVRHDSYWTRDYGPWFILDGNDEISVVDFTYNRPSRPYDDVALVAVANKLNVSRYEMPMVHTGGNYMVDGYGTAASTDLVLEENPTQSLAALQTMANDYLGVDNYMFLDDPLGDYIAHIDCWGKFLSVDKVLIGQVAQSDSRYARYEAIASQFENALTPWGNHYQVFRVYTPGNNLTTPYTNSLILNDHVFVPVTGCQWDDAAIEVYQQAMPGYTIVPIMRSINTPWYNTDALHCRTHELADQGMLYIKHYPVLGQQVDGVQDVTMTAEIRALSGQPLVQDSLLVYYRINNGNWQSMPLQPVGGNQFEATLTDLQSDAEVDYYLFAKDQSGRRECHPYIGAADPHHFYMHSVGIADPIEDAVVSVYPNPCVDVLTIEMSQSTLQRVEIYDVLGKCVYVAEPSANILKISVRDYPAGVYNIRMIDEQGRVGYKKMMHHPR